MRDREPGAPFDIGGAPVEGHFLMENVIEAPVNGRPADIRVSVQPELRAQKVPQLFRAQITIRSSRGPQMVDITDHVQGLLDATGLQEGQVLIYSKHTTAGIVVQENEPLLIQDMYAFLERVASPAGEYSHNNFDIRTVNMCDDECANGHAHLQHLLIGCNQTVPFTNGKLDLGRWQRVFMLEMDRPRERDIVLQFSGC